jgi:hypothetical protein
MKERNKKWLDFIGVCMDAASVMTGNKERLQALIKHLATEAIWTHCMVHRD